MSGDAFTYILLRIVRITTPFCNGGRPPYWN